MSWVSEMFERAMRRARGRDDAVEFAIRETIEECARRTCLSADRAYILAMLEDK